MAQKHVINKPGGVILHLSDGSAEHFQYGTEVDPDKLADYQRQTLDKFTDSKDRSAYVQTPQVEQEAHRNAAFADGGQVNSTSDPVPGNYDQLSEEDAAQLVLSLQNDPQIQARVLLHERVAAGARQQVIDAGSPEATAIAEQLYEHHSAGITRFAQTPVLDREREVERESRSQERSSKGKGRSSGKGSTPSPNSD